MEMVDFEYDGELLSDYGCIPVEFVTEREDSPLGMKPSFKTVKINDIDYIASSQYEEVLTKSFDIIRDPCLTDGTQDGMTFEDTEIYRISRWLQRKRYLKFKPLYDSDDFTDLVFYGTFDVREIRFNGLILGFTLNFTSNAPYGFSDPETVTRNLDSNSLYQFIDGKEYKYFDIYNNSQEMGFIYPDRVTITIHGNGDLVLMNTKDYFYSSEGQEQVVTKISNCIDGEVITMDCKNKIIQSNMEHPTLYNDFNYNFPRLITGYEDDNNRFLWDPDQGLDGIDIEFVHSPIRKVGIM